MALNDDEVRSSFLTGGENEKKTRRSGRTKSVAAFGQKNFRKRLQERSSSESVLSRSLVKKV